MQLEFVNNHNDLSISALLDCFSIQYIYLMPVPLNFAQEYNQKSLTVFSSFSPIKSCILSSNFTSSTCVLPFLHGRISTTSRPSTTLEFSLYSVFTRHYNAFNYTFTIRSWQTQAFLKLTGTWTMNNNNVFNLTIQ